MKALYDLKLPKMTIVYGQGYICVQMSVFYSLTDSKWSFGVSASDHSSFPICVLLDTGHILLYGELWSFLLTLSLLPPTIKLGKIKLPIDTDKDCF